MESSESEEIVTEPEEKVDRHAPGENGVHPDGLQSSEPSSARRAEIDAKQEQVGAILESMGCEAAILLLPANVCWFTSGLNVRGLIADGERPGIYTNGRQRWLLCSNVDTQRFFDEELDQLGFQLKEWTWSSGRSELLMNVSSGRKVTADRPFPNVPLINEKLRPLIRVLAPFELQSYRHLGRLVAHAVEATARALAPGQSEEEIAGQVGHRIIHHGAEVSSVSVTADARTAKYRRAGFTSASIEQTCVIQATAHRDGLYATTSRAISFGRPGEDFLSGYDRALRLSALYRAASTPGQTIATAQASENLILAGTPHEFDGRMSQPGYGTGRFPAEELRRAGHDEPFVAGQAIVWQLRIGSAAVVDTIVVGDDGPECFTPPTEWPFKRVTIRGRHHDIPDLLVR